MGAAAVYGPAGRVRPAVAPTDRQTLQGEAVAPAPSARARTLVPCGRCIQPRF